jgi:hypothetical protein
VPSRDSHGIFRSHFRVLERIGMGQFCWVADKTDIPGA